MNTSDHRFAWRGEAIRVVVAGDVLALPLQGWSRGGFGTSIEAGWLLREGGLPGGAEKRRALAEALVRSLTRHHGRAAGLAAQTVEDLAEVPGGTFVQGRPIPQSGDVIEMDCLGEWRRVRVGQVEGDSVYSERETPGAVIFAATLAGRHWRWPDEEARP